MGLCIVQFLLFEHGCRMLDGCAARAARALDKRPLCVRWSERVPQTLRGGGGGGGWLWRSVFLYGVRVL